MMKRLLLVCGAVCDSATKKTDELFAPVRRQVDGAVSEGVFFRKGFHSSAVLNGRVYIDGGEVSYSNSSETGGVEYQYSDSLIYIDITADFSPSSVTVASIDKPDGVSNLPSSDGSDGTWTNLNDTTDTFFTTDKRPFGAPVASGNGTAFLLGGLDVFGMWHVPVSGLLSYNFSSQTMTNTTVSTSTDGFLQMGSMHAGGNHGYQKSSGDWASNWQAFDTVQVFDIASGTWYDQITTGTVPPFRMQYCMTGAASLNHTYEILVYAGWNNTLGDYVTSFDAAYVLSLPSQYDASNQYRGVFHTKDPFPQGLNIFDLSSMSFTDAFEANKTTYDYADALSTYYQTRDRISSSMGDSLRAVFAVEDFTTSATAVSGSSSGSSGSSSGSESSSSGGDSGSRSESGSGTSQSNTGAIAGGVIGGVIGVALIAAAVFFILRRRRGGQYGSVGQGNRKGGAAEIDSEKTHQLSDGSEPYMQRFQVAGDPEAAEVPGSKPVGYAGGRAELA